MPVVALGIKTTVSEGVLRTWSMIRLGRSRVRPRAFTLVTASRDSLMSLGYSYRMKESGRASASSWKWRSWSRTALGYVPKEPRMLDVCC